MSATHSSAELKSNLKRVRGLGSAKSGTKHFWHQRLTALANVPLALITLWAVLSTLGDGWEEAAARIGSLFVGPFVLLFVLSAFYHAALGLSNVIEDYVNGEAARMVALILMRFGLIVLGSMAALSIIRLMVTA